MEGARAGASGQGDWLWVTPEKGATLQYGKLHAYDADGVALPSRLEVKPGGKGLRLLTDVQGARFPIVVDPFIQQQVLSAFDGAANDNFGYSAALNSAGDIAIFGAYQKTVNGNTKQGAAYVFTRNGTVWSQQQILTDTTTGAVNDYFGYSVALNGPGDTAFIGAQNKTVGINGAQGAAYVFTRSGAVWSQQQIFTDTAGAGSDGFGRAVAVNSAGDLALIGSPFKAINGNSAQGATFVFSRNGAIWSQQQILTDTTTGAGGDLFGYSVGLNSAGNIGIIGAINKNVNGNMFQGVAYIFTRTGTTWNQQQVLSDTITGASNDRFGWSVALNSAGDTALIGATFKKIGTNNLQGAAYVFSWNGATWSQQQRLTDSAGAFIDYFGYSVALNGAGDTALVGSYGKDNMGAGLVFTRTGTVWNQSQVLTDSTSVALDTQLGRSVALNGVGDFAVIGAPNKQIGANNSQGAAVTYSLCNTLLVTNTTDDGTGTVCGTFSFALTQSAGVTITFALSQGSTISFTNMLSPTVKNGVTIDGGAGITLDGNGMSGDGLQLQGSDILINLTIRKFAGRQLVTLGRGNKLQRVIVQKT